MRTSTNTSFVLMTAVLAAGLCIASALAAVSVMPARVPSAGDNPISAVAQSRTVAQNGDMALLTGNTETEWAVLDLGGTMPEDLSVSRVYFQ